MSPPILLLRDIHLSFGSSPLFEGSDLSVSERDRLCLVGRNGSGKSTLLKIASGIIEPDSGERFFQPGKTLQYLPQEPKIKNSETVLSYIQDGLTPGEDFNQVHSLLEQLKLSGLEKLKNLSGGELRRCAIVKALAPKPDILLLDEPTNHLDLPTIEWLEHYLVSIRSAFVIISHDRFFLEKLSEGTIWLSQGKTERLEQNFCHFENWRDKIINQEEIKRHQLDRKIKAETQWLQKGVTARRKRNQGRLRALQNLRKKRRELWQQAGRVVFSNAGGVLSGKIVVEAKSISKNYNNRSIIQNFSTRVQRGDRVGIVGPNGAGKTTLLNLLNGALIPDSGNVRHGTNLQMRTLDQRREKLNDKVTLSEALTGGGNTVTVAGKSRHVISYMKDFLFDPNQANTPVNVLSGGERGRLILARAFSQPSNFLTLDEPTNDLDFETLDVLQEIISDYPGTILLVSHDRDFLDRTVTSIICWEGNGLWIEYAGGYTDMLSQGGVNFIEKTKTFSNKRENKKGKPLNNKRSADAARNKLSYKDKHALETLGIRIQNLQKKIAEDQETLADPALFNRNQRLFTETAEALKKTESELAAAEEQWLEIELKREQFEDKNSII